MIPPSQISIGGRRRWPIAGTYRSEEPGLLGDGRHDHRGRHRQPGGSSPRPADHLVARHHPRPDAGHPEHGWWHHGHDAQPTTSGATAGIYPLWLHGHSASPYLRDHYEPFYINVGGVARSFTMTTDAKTRPLPRWAQMSRGRSPSPRRAVARRTSTATSRCPSSACRRNRDDHLVGRPGSASAKVPAPTTPGPSPINTGTTAPGDYPIHLRATGTNSRASSDAPARARPPVAAAPPSVNYVDILGFAVFRVRTSEPTRCGAMRSPAWPPIQTIPSCSAVRWRGWCPGTSRTGTAHRLADPTGARGVRRLGTREA